MSDLEVQLHNSLAALDDLKASFEQQRLAWQQEREALHLQLAQLRRNETALLQQNALLTGKLADLGSSPENNGLLHQFRLVEGHIEVLARDAAAFNAYLATLDIPEEVHA